MNQALLRCHYPGVKHDIHDSPVGRQGLNLSTAGRAGARCIHHGGMFAIDLTIGVSWSMVRPARSRYCHGNWHHGRFLVTALLGLFPPSMIFTNTSVPSVTTNSFTLSVMGSIISHVSFKCHEDFFARCDLFLPKDVPIQKECRSRKDREHVKASAEFVTEMIVLKVSEEL